MTNPNPYTKGPEPMQTLDSVATPESWQHLAACSGAADAHYDPWHSDDKSVAAAKAICKRCPVTTACLAQALVHDERHGAIGVWGGLAAHERVRLVEGRASA